MVFRKRNKTPKGNHYDHKWSKETTKTNHQQLANKRKILSKKRIVQGTIQKRETQRDYKNSEMNLINQLEESKGDGDRSGQSKEWKKLDLLQHLRLRALQLQLINKSNCRFYRYLFAYLQVSLNCFLFSQASFRSFSATDENSMFITKSSQPDLITTWQLPSKIVRLKNTRKARE